jgi:hypothetical protein
MKRQPEYTPGDAVEIYVPHLDEYHWIYVEEVKVINGVQRLRAEGAEFFFCACLVNTQVHALPHEIRRSVRRGKASLGTVGMARLG